MHNNQEVEKQQYILKCNSIGEIVSSSVLYDIPGKLQFDYKAFCPLQISVVLNADISTSVAGAEAIPQLCQ